MHKYVIINLTDFWLTFDLSTRRLVVFTAQMTSGSCCVDHGKRLDQFNFNWETQLMSSWDFYSRKNIDQSQKGIVCCLLIQKRSALLSWRTSDNESYKNTQFEFSSEEKNIYHQLENEVDWSFIHINRYSQTRMVDWVWLLQKLNDA